MQIDGLRHIAGRFDAMLIDQFGVIHDGAQLYPGTLRVLNELHARKIPVIIMTNSAKRAAANRQRLEKMGIARALYVDAVSSGEVAYASLKRIPSYVIGRQGDDYGFDGIPLVSDPATAEQLLILGSNAPQTSLDQYRIHLAGLRAPAICCNPDKLMLTAGGLQPAPGAIAALYEEMGGNVTWIGKPYPVIYRHALALLGNPSRVLCIGDSAEHDVQGAHNAGLPALLIRTGVSAGLSNFDPEPEFWANQFIW
jgi:HAD superfamily hydrolase (TIGR01459 family)